MELGSSTYGKLVDGKIKNKICATFGKGSPTRENKSAVLVKGLQPGRTKVLLW